MFLLGLLKNRSELVGSILYRRGDHDCGEGEGQDLRGKRVDSMVAVLSSVQTVENGSRWTESSPLRDIFKGRDDDGEVGLMYQQNQRRNKRSNLLIPMNLSHGIIEEPGYPEFNSLQFGCDRESNGMAS